MEIENIVDDFISHGNWMKIEEMIKYGMDVNIKIYDAPLLMHALSQNNSSAIEMLIRYNVDLDAKDDRGYTPLVFATKNIEEERSSLITILLNGGANVFITTDDGESIEEHLDELDKCTADLIREKLACRGKHIKSAQKLIV
jgi:ankyrin repeat protein